MTLEEWERSVPGALTRDVLWRVTAYRLATFLSDLAWRDVTKLMKDRRTVGLSDQLYRATGSIGSNISEGYSRSTGKDRARFYEYALGSARESRDWYFKGRFVLSEKVMLHRLALLEEIIKLLIKMVSDQRATRSRLDPTG